METKKVTAKFETVDLAELAARGIKNNFPQVKYIRIRYKNNPEDNQNDPTEGYNPENQSFLNFFAGSTVGFDNSGSSVFPVYAYLNQKPHSNSHDKTPEIEQSTESRIIIEANANLSKAIESKLRCLGGYQIEVF